MDKKIEELLVGQESVLRALEVSIAGEHSLCIVTEDRERFQELPCGRVVVVTPCPCGFSYCPAYTCECSAEAIRLHRKSCWPGDADIYITASPGRMEDLLKVEKPALQKEAKELLAMGFDKLGLLYSEGKKILQVARTIAELEGQKVIAASHMAEALQYRGERS